jgi:aspartyl/glutamyl-tRNA(Asn/Gln) amidotransferase C subunit
MPNNISRDTFEHLVELAALDLSAEEADYLYRELNAQLASIDELAAIPLDDAQSITSHGVPYTDATSPAIREDVWDADKNVEAILAQAPELEERYIVVPDIPHEELD